MVAKMSRMTIRSERGMDERERVKKVEKERRCQWSKERGRVSETGPVQTRSTIRQRQKSSVGRSGWSAAQSSPG